MAAPKESPPAKKPSVYIETSIVSYLAARPSRDPIVRAQQLITHRWWAARENYALVASLAVVQEAAAGDSGAARRRLEYLEGIRLLSVTGAERDLAKIIASETELPPNAEIDAPHVASAVVGGVEYLMTWNCSHLASAVFRPRIESVCRERGYTPPVICTPLELS